MVKSDHTKETNISSEGSSGDDDEKVEEGSNSSGRRGNASGNDANQNMNSTINTIVKKLAFQENGKKYNFHLNRLYHIKKSWTGKTRISCFPYFLLAISVDMDLSRALPPVQKF